MQLRRAVPLSLLALLASAGCVSVGPGSPAPARDSVPPVGSPDRAGGTGDTDPLPALSVPLPLGVLPEPEPDPEEGTDRKRPAVKAARPPAKRPAEPAAPPRRVRPAQPAPLRLPRPTDRLPRVDEPCAAAEGAVPPSIVDLCVRQYGQYGQYGQ